MTGKSQLTVLRTLTMWAVAMALLAVQPAWAQNAMLGDVNKDGTCNILDIQCCINQALGNAGPTPEADVDENGQPDIVDVQNMVNTALGEGGLIQRVRGTLDCEGDPTRLRIRAVSMDGDTVECDVDPDTLQFNLRLRVKTAWAISMIPR